MRLDREQMLSEVIVKMGFENEETIRFASLLEEVETIEKKHDELIKRELERIMSL